MVETLVDEARGLKTWFTGVKTKTVLILVSLGIGVVGGMALEWRITNRKNPTPEASQAIQMKDGALVLPVTPSAQPIPHPSLPVGAKIIRQASVVVTTGSHQEGASTIQSPTIPSIPPTLTLNWNELQMKDGSDRLEVSTPDGQILSGVDLGREPEPKTLNWTVSATYTVDWLKGRKVWGAMITRNCGPFVAGVAVNRDGATASVGVRF
jgi:hypothetical protein